MLNQDLNQKPVARIRAHVKMEVTVKTAHVLIQDAHIVNISLSGMLLKAEAELPVGALCETRISLNAKPPIYLKMDGHVVRQTTEGFAINFDDMSSDTLEHLKHLVMYNAENPTEVDRQNFRHPGFK
jgi:hypothetical protein